MVLESYDFTIDALKGTTDAQLADQVKVFGKDMNRETAFAKQFEHQTYHQGQTTIYIRMKGIKPPNMFTVGRRLKTGWYKRVGNPLSLSR